MIDDEEEGGYKMITKKDKRIKKNKTIMMKTSAES